MLPGQRQNSRRWKCEQEDGVVGEGGSPALDRVVPGCSGGDAGVIGPRMYLSHMCK